MYSSVKDNSPFAGLIKNGCRIKFKGMDFWKITTFKNGIPTGWMDNISLGKNMPTKDDWNS